ncbi:MAG: hypothetical protein LBV62_01165 [Rickettsiales bacterium]|nr:hypothetical protein [Rickettsiales bacterium]
MLSQCLLFFVIPVPRHWDPENLTLNKWLHNKPVPATCMTPFMGS